MPIELHERLSEFSYGYGITREVEVSLRQNGLKATPFLPSLLHEAKIGCDVAFDLPGSPLMLQFKLGQSMRRFLPGPRPTLQVPFWRYRIDTAEPDGQFEILLKAEMDGADVFYLAPKFHDWQSYLDAFEHRNVVQRSLIISPDQIRRTLASHGIPDGPHRVVYDENVAYLCSKPLELKPIRNLELASQLRARVESRKIPIGKVLNDVFEGFENRSDIRRSSDSKIDPDRFHYGISFDHEFQSELRQKRLERILETGRSHEEAVALAVGAEAWSSGAQLIFVTELPLS